MGLRHIQPRPSCNAGQNEAGPEGLRGGSTMSQINTAETA